MAGEGEEPLRTDGDGQQPEQEDLQDALAGAWPLLHKEVDHGADQRQGEEDDHEHGQGFLQSEIEAASSIRQVWPAARDSSVA